MADPYYGEIRPFAFSYPPQDWAQCNGQLMQIQQNTALYSVIGLSYGGDGKTTFGLPDLRGRVPVHRNGTSFPVGGAQGMGGAATVTITATTMGLHGHNLVAANVNGTQALPGNGDTPPLATSMLAIAATVGGFSANRPKPMYADPTEQVEMASTAVGYSCGSGGAALAHDNTQPSLALNFCICLYGNYPMRP